VSTNDDTAVFEAPAVLRMLATDPEHMAEHLAVWSVSHFGTRAGAAVAELRRDHPAAEHEELERLAIERQTRVSMAEGAVVGGPFIVLMPVAFCAALLAQAQMALELAALSGYAPDDAMRAADLLVLQGAYPTVELASAAIADVTNASVARGKRRFPSFGMVRRMAYLLGLLGAGEEKPSRLRSALGIVLLGVVFLVSFVMPLVWAPYIAVGMRRSALRMGQRAHELYAGRRSNETGVAVRHTSTVRVAVSAGLVRLLVLICLPLVVCVIAVATDLEIGTGRWLTGGILLIVVSALATLFWIGRRWLQRRRNRRTRPEPAFTA
jgi:hypothetical protein